MNRVIHHLALPIILFITGVPVAFCSVKAIPLPELVKASDVIITGRIIKTEKIEIREGVYEVICHIRADSILKGKPKTQDITIQNKTFATVLIQFYDGKQVPSGKVIYGLGEEGIWFLSPIEKSTADLYAAGSYQDLSSVDDVKKELQNQRVDLTRPERSGDNFTEQNKE